jgi:acetoin utilization deacetylase AcuC-like enzyme
MVVHQCVERVERQGAPAAHSFNKKSKILNVHQKKHLRCVHSAWESEDDQRKKRANRAIPLTKSMLMHGACRTDTLALGSIVMRSLTKRNFRVSSCTASYLSRVSRPPTHHDRAQTNSVGNRKQGRIMYLIHAYRNAPRIGDADTNLIITPDTFQIQESRP